MINLKGCGIWRLPARHSLATRILFSVEPAVKDVFVCSFTELVIVGKQVYSVSQSRPATNCFYYYFRLVGVGGGDSEK